MIKEKNMYKPSPDRNKIVYSYFQWGPFLFHTQITPEECQILLEEGKKCRKKSNDYRHRLAGHLAEEYTLTEVAPAIGKWLPKYLYAYGNAFKQWNKKQIEIPHFKVTSLWINYMKANDFNPPHSHTADLSFILYPHVPEDLIQENKNYKGTAVGPGGVSWVYGEGTQFCTNVVSRMPEARDLYIFPAFLKHWVFPFKSDVERISISGNMVVAEPPKQIQVLEKGI